LAHAFQAHGLHPYHLKRIVDARVRPKPLDLGICIDFSFKIAELDNPTHMSMETLTNHIESTYSTLLYLLLQSTSKSSPSEIHHAASHLGLAHGLMTLLRALPFHAANRRLVIPAEISSKHGVNQEEVFRHGSEARGISDAVFDFATRANDNLLVAREMFGKLGLDQQRAALPVFLIGVCFCLKRRLGTDMK
jgi:NADH dehydrogenase [ubiquinone] 1 alpha subcomplex assembly factor 6